MSMHRQSNKNVFARNRKARYNYSLLKSFTAGVSLFGFEVKAVRKGQVDLKDSYVRIENNEAWLFGTKITLLPEANITDYDPIRKRKLLLKRSEIKELFREQETSRITIVPLKFFQKGKRIKLEISLATGRKKYDKREAIKLRDQEREIREDLAEIREF